MEPLAQMNCPACGSPALVQASVTTLRCENCNSVVQRSTSTTFLEVLGTGCYSCGAANDKGIKYCTNCGAELIVACPNCESLIVLGHKRCGQCGIDLPNKFGMIFEEIENKYEQNNRIISENKESITEYESNKEKKSKGRSKNILAVFIFSIIGALIFSLFSILGTTLHVSVSALIFLCTFSITYIGFLLLIYISIESGKNTLNKKINHAQIQIQEKEEENEVLAVEIHKYKEIMSAYNGDY